MEIRINKKVFNSPNNFGELKPDQLRYIYMRTTQDLWSDRGKLFKLISGVSQNLINQWAKDANGLVELEDNIGKYKVTEFNIEYGDVLSQSLSFIFQRDMKTDKIKLQPNIYPPVKGIGFGEAFKSASFQDFAMVNKYLQQKNSNNVIKFLTPQTFKRKLRPWQKNAIYHYAYSCHSHIVNALPTAMRKQNNGQKQSKFGMAMVMMEMAGEKLGTINQVKQTNVWDIVVELNRLEKVKEQLKSKGKK